MPDDVRSGPRPFILVSILAGSGSGGGCHLPIHGQGRFSAQPVERALR